MDSKPGSRVCMLLLPRKLNGSSLIRGRDSVSFSNIGLCVVLASQAVCGLAAVQSQLPSSTVADRANPVTPRACSWLRSKDTCIVRAHYYAVAGQPGRACDDTQVLLTGNKALRFGVLCDIQSALKLPHTI